MKKIIILMLAVTAISITSKSQSFIYKGRQDTVPVTMLVSGKFMTDKKLYVNDSTSYYVANVFQIRGFEVLPEHSQPFYLDENKKLFEPNIYLIVWMVFPYNYHSPIKFQ